MSLFTLISDSIDKDLTPQNRSLNDIAIVLSEAYGLVDSIGWETVHPFDEPHSFLAISRTKVERDLAEINGLPKSNGLFTVSSKGLEKVISDVALLKEILSSPAANPYQPVFSGMIRAHIRYLLELTSTGILLKRKQRVLNEVWELPMASQRITFLKEKLIRHKQARAFSDSDRYVEFKKFLKLEIQRHQLAADAGETYGFSSEEELAQFVFRILQEELQHNVRYQEGYRNFWRDEKCTDPKKEVEVQQYIQTVLETSCKREGVKLSREVTSANGSIDINFTFLNFCVCLEIKKASHPRLASANRQLAAYISGERTNYGILLVLWHYPIVNGNTPEELKNFLIANLPSPKPQILVTVIDCRKPASPSTLK